MEIENAQNPAVEPAQGAQVETPAQDQAIIDLDGVSRFTVSGQEYTPDQLSKIFNEHKRYSEDQSSYTKNKVYYDNLDIDLRNVRNDPNLADMFRERYPKEFHKYLSAVLQEEKREVQAQGQQAPAGIPKEFLNEFGQIKRQLQSVLEESHNAKVEASLAKIDALLPPLMTKFPMADDNAVLTRAEAMLQSGIKLTDKTWERLVRESHEGNEKKWSTHQAAKLKEQTEKGRRAQDTAAGGSAPGHAQVKPKTFDQAREAMLEYVKARGRG